MTIDDEKKRWEKKLWDAFDETAHYFRINGPSLYDLQLSMYRLVNMLDQVACEGFWVELSHVKDEGLRGMAFVKASPKDVRMAREIYKIKYKEEPWATQKNK